VNWRTAVRVGIAAVGLGVAATVFVYGRRHQPAPRLPIDPPKLDSNVTLLGGPGEQLMFKGNQPSAKITFKESKSYDDGHLRLQDAVVNGLGDKPFTLTAAVLETVPSANRNERPNELKLSGGFSFAASDGLIVESDAGTYDDKSGVLTIPGSVKFKRGRVSGTSTGAVYDRAQDSVTMLDAVTARIEADAQGKGASEATSKKMVMLRGQHSVQLEEDARITSDNQVLSGQTATMLFAEDETALKYLQLRGNARVAPKPGAPAGQQTMSSDDLTMSFYPDGVTMQHATLTGRAQMSTTDQNGCRSIRATWIDFFTGKDGQTLTQLQARDKVIVEIPPAANSSGRTITSATLSATGDEKKGLTSAKFEGEPCFVEEPAATARSRGASASTPCAAKAVMHCG